jgi:hypothetical protein
MPRRIKIGVLTLAALISIAGWKSLDALLRPTPGRRVASVQGDTSMAQKIKKFDVNGKEFLTPEQDPASELC